MSQYQGFETYAFAFHLGVVTAFSPPELKGYSGTALLQL